MRMIREWETTDCSSWMKNFSRRSLVAVWLEEEEAEQDGDEVRPLEKYGEGGIREEVECTKAGSLCDGVVSDKWEMLSEEDEGEKSRSNPLPKEAKVPVTNITKDARRWRTFRRTALTRTHTYKCVYTILSREINEAIPHEDPDLFRKG